MSAGFVAINWVMSTVRREGLFTSVANELEFNGSLDPQSVGT